MTGTDADFLARAIALACRNVAAGGGPFGALVVDGTGAIAGTGVNRVTRIPDPTAHAEVSAIRAASLELDEFDLTGLTLFTSCEPCPLCLSAALWARLDRVVYAADRHAAQLAGFDDRSFYELFRVDREADWPLSLEHVEHPDSAAPFEAWRAHEARIDY